MTSDGFVLDAQLAQDTIPVGDAGLSRILLMNNKLYPWLILVPARSDLVELTDLTLDEMNLLMHELHVISSVMQSLFKPYKMNIAALGNQVRQLHIHLIARKQDDSAWPNPVWGTGGEPYSEVDASLLISRIQNALATTMQEEAS